MKPINVYIDYSSFLVGCSHQHALNVEKFLLELITLALNSFTVHGVFVIADWRRMGQRETLTSEGVHCIDALGTSSISLRHQAQELIESELQKGKIEGVLLIAGPINFGPIIEQLKDRNYAVHIWATSPLKPTIKVLLDSWKFLPVPSKVNAKTNESNWNRRSILQAIILITEELHQTGNDVIETPKLTERLSRIRHIQANASAWINVAIWENLLYLQTKGEDRYLVLNHNHRLVELTLHTCQRIVSVLQAMLGDVGWVAFRSLENALSSSHLLNGKRRHRFEWIEIMVETRIFNSEKRRQSNGIYETTVLMPNSNHVAILGFELQQHLRLAQLIITFDNFRLRHRNYAWMAVSTLLKYLTGLMTRVEARETLANAQEQMIIQLDRVKSRANPQNFVSTLTLNQRHPVVAEVLSRRDEIINFLHSMLLERYRGLDRRVIEQDLMQAYHISFQEVSMWIDLFLIDQILVENIVTQSNGYEIYSLSLNTDPVVNAIVD